MMCCRQRSGSEFRQQNWATLPVEMREWKVSCMNGEVEGPGTTSASERQETGLERGIDSWLSEASTMPSKGMDFRPARRADLEWLRGKPEETKLPNYPRGKSCLLLERSPGQSFPSQGAYGTRRSLWRGESVVQSCQGARRQSWKSSVFPSLPQNAPSSEGFPSKISAHSLLGSGTQFGDTDKKFEILRNSTAWNVDPNIHL